LYKKLFFVSLTICFLLLIPFSIASLSYSWGMGLEFMERNIDLFETIWRYSSSLILITLCLAFGYVFYKDGISRYRISEISGIIGIFTFMLSLIFLSIWPVFSWGILISGILCFYAASVPTINMIYEKMNINNWEKGTIAALISFILLYFISYKSNILINDIFSVDPKHFYFTKFIAGIIVVAPCIFVISFLSLVYNLYKMAKNDNNLFYFFTGFIASYCFLISSLAFNAGGSTIIRNFASVVDFNSNSICMNVDKSHGVIYLDNIYQLILIDKKENGIHSYEIIKCNIGI